MKRIYKILLLTAALIAVIFVILNLLLPSFAKKAIVEQIEKNFNVSASLEGVNITPPLSINLTGLKIGDIFQARRISLSPNLLGLFAGKIVLSGVTIIEPIVRIEQSGKGTLNIPQPQGSGNTPPIYMTGLTVRNGEVVFTDKKVTPQGFKVMLANINADISKVVLPIASLKINFKLAADFIKPDNQKIGNMDFQGWVDFGTKDMDGALEVKDLDIVYFAPYYGDFISNKKLLSAVLNTKTTLISKNNNLSTVTNFRLSNLVYAESEEGKIEEDVSLDLTRRALDLFTDAKGNLELEFDFNTKLDNPSVSIAQLQKIILKAAAKNIINQNPEDLLKKVSDNIEHFKSIGEELEKIFKSK